MRTAAVCRALLALGCDQRGNHTAERACTCIQPDGGTTSATGARLFCDQPSDEVLQLCSTESVMLPGARRWVSPPDDQCVSLTACHCELLGIGPGGLLMKMRGTRLRDYTLG